jgi:hypothetical protein
LVRTKLVRYGLLTKLLNMHQQHNDDSDGGSVFPQERYHDYILRRLREEDEAYQRQERSGSGGDD